MLNLVVTPRAQNSLEEIIDYYLTKHSSERAIKVIQSTEGAFDDICHSPGSYPVCYDIKVPVKNIRQKIVHHTFKIVYRITEKNVEIIEIFHGRRNPKLIKDITS